jgi:hypothetical protein
MNTTNTIVVYAGFANQSQPVEPQSDNQAVKVEEFLVHPTWYQNQLVDIGLLRLSSPLRFNGKPLFIDISP